MLEYKSILCAPFSVLPARACAAVAHLRLLRDATCPVFPETFVAALRICRQVRCAAALCASSTAETAAQVEYTSALGSVRRRLCSASSRTDCPPQPSTALLLVLSSALFYRCVRHSARWTAEEGVSGQAGSIRAFCPPSSEHFRTRSSSPPPHRTWTFS